MCEYQYRENDNPHTEAIERYMQMPLAELEALMLQEEEKVFKNMGKNKQDAIEYLVLDDTIDIGKEAAPITEEEHIFRDDLIEHVKKTCLKNKPQQQD